MTKLTDAIFKHEVREEAKIKTADRLERFFVAVKRNLKVLTETFEQCNNNVDDSLTQLISIESDLTLFTYQPFDVRQYKLNTIGDCVITKIGNRLDGQCFINDLKK